ncbi:MAG: hypothetical protein GVY33_08795 [Alphaproteobacteria bacterium]|nr:hypothetical protein [Alphaproteobacteria bacterium]
MGASFFTNIASFLHEQAALVSAGRWLDLNGWVVLGAIALALLVLSRGIAWTRRNLRCFARTAVMVAVFSTMIGVYYVAMLAYGLFWWWIYQEIQVHFGYAQRLDLAVATAGAALLTAALAIRIFRPRRTRLPGSHAGIAAARGRG